MNYHSRFDGYNLSPKKKWAPLSWDKGILFLVNDKNYIFDLNKIKLSMKLKFIVFIMLAIGLSSCGLKKQVSDLSTKNKDLITQVSELTQLKKDKELEVDFLLGRVQELENNPDELDLQSEVIVNSAEIMPAYSGEQSINEFLDVTLADMGANGNGQTVYVEMIVFENGELSRMKPVRSVSSSLDSQAVTALKKSSPWTPGIINGNKVKVRMVIPVTFK
jgi:hypothetical protein